MSQIIDVTTYPNPTSGVLSIETEENIISITLSSSNGRILAKTKSNNFDLSQYSNGIYFINIQTDKGFVTKKILKN